MNGLLFIDDEEGIRRAMARALKSEPYQVYTVSNGDEGIEFVKRDPDRVHLVISDFKMPGRDGLNTLAAIGAINSQITRIILTGYATMQTAIDATNQGVDGFLTKPFNNVELRAKIRSIFVRKHLKAFIPEPVRQHIEAAEDPLSPSFHEVTVLFSDIRDFTRMTRQVSPETIVGFLNRDYFSPMGEIAYEYGGMVDKHIGDSIMVSFGAPVPKPDDSLRAVQAALAMQAKAVEIDRQLDGRDGLRLKIGIGLATGRVFSGVLGSLRKKEFTSIGTAVNVAARLQDIAAPGEILVTQQTVDQLGASVEAQALDPVHLKGIGDSILIYRILGNYRF